MNDQILSHQKEPLSKTTRSFILGILFIIFILVIAVFGGDLNRITDVNVLDCDDPASVLRALDQSRNGIVNGCI